MGARPVRAPRGAELSCRGWPQEAAFRMLQNNLDPEVAERPDDLVVYGGTGRAARSWEAFDAMLRDPAHARRRRDDARPVGQAGRRVPHPRVGAAGAASPTPTSCRTGPTGTSSAASRPLGLTMYGQMTAGSWIYIGTQGILQGTYECFAEIARRRFGGIAGRHDHAHRRARRDGRRPAAGGHDERRRRAVHRRRPGARIQRRLETRYLDEVADRPRRRHRPLHSRPATSAGPSPSALVGNAAEVAAAAARRSTSRPTSSPTRPAPTTR